MAEGRSLTATTGDGGAGADDLRAASGTDLFREGRAPARAHVHVLVALAMVAGAFFLPRDAASSATGWHVGVEVAAISMALVLGGLALVRYYARWERTLLYIGTGFVAAAVLDALHLLVASGLVPGADPGARAQLTAWSWTQARTFLALFLSVSVLAPRFGGPEGRKGGENSVFATAALLTLAVTAVFSLLPLAPAIHPELPLSRPAEMLPAVLFGLAFVGLYRRRRWRQDPFEHWLLISILVGGLLHALYMSRSQALGDTFYVAAHILKMASYGAALVGLLVSLGLAFRREGEALEAVTSANAALGREVAVRREAEEVLQRSEERLQNFLDNAHDLIQSTAPDGRILYVNAAWTRTLGYDGGDLQRLRLADILHESCRESVISAFRHVLAGEEVPRITAEYVARDGRKVVCSGSATRHVVDGVPVSVQAIFRDVTEQRSAERELAASRANVEALVENTGDAIWSVDTEQRLVTFNSAFALGVEARTGREPRKGDIPEVIFGTRDASWYRHLYDRVLSGQRFSTLREERVGGLDRVVEIFCNPVLEAGGTTGAVMFGKDVTRRLRAEEALRLAKDEAEMANRAKSQFLANMSHELRTPLNSVIGFANILLKNKRGNLQEQDVSFLDRILANGRHLLVLINEVLDLAKIEAGRLELEVRDVDLGELVRQTVAQLEGQAREKNVKLAADLPDGDVHLETDPDKLKQVIINLVGNAVKFSEGGSVTVRVEAGADGETPEAVAVADTGIGIPPERLEAIFEAFQQADTGTSRRYGGTGLGLTISRSLCQLLGYDLEVESEVGEGSTFTIRLQPASEDDTDEGAGTEALAPPARKPEPEGAAKPEAPGFRAGGLGRQPGSEFRVLVVDDEADSRVLLTHYLEDLGCRVTTAGSGREALDEARHLHPDLVTLDLMMPDMNGWEVLRLMKEDPDLRDIPVVVVSIVASEGRGRLLGAVDLLSKPVDREDLVRVLWKNLVRHRTPRVLVVEDDPDARVVVSAYLEGAGLEVRAVANGEEALEAVQAEAPDAVVLDLMMPVMDGLSFLERLRDSPYHAGLPVVVLTGKPLAQREEKTLQEKASTVVPKDDMLEDRLREVLSAFLPLEA